MEGLITQTMAEDLKLRWLLVKYYPECRINGMIFRTQAESIRVHRSMLRRIGYNTSE